MDDPELQSDETILMRTPNIFVKSTPFEGILTNRRIILIDRAKNLLPTKEIPLATIKELQPGENALRDQTITLSVLAKNNITRQVILTFSRFGGGNRTRERDEWMQYIRDSSTSTIGRVIRKSIPGFEPVPKKGHGALSPKIEIIGTPVTSPRPVKTGTAGISPGDQRPDNPPSLPRQVPASPRLSPGTFCSRCGNRVPDGSVFCNRCGTRLVTPVDTPTVFVQPQVPVSQPAPGSASTRKERSVDREIQSIEPLMEISAVIIPRDPLRAATPEPQPVSPQTSPPIISRQVPPEPECPVPAAPSFSEIPPPQPVQVSAPAQSPKKSARGFIPRLFSPKNPKPKPTDAGLMPAALPTSPRPRRGKGKFIAIGIFVIIIAVLAGGVVLQNPKTGTETGTSILTPPETAGPVDTVSATVTQGPPVTMGTRPEATAVTIPSTGVWVHVNYIGGWKGMYGPSDALQQKTSSGERLYEVESSTAVVQASFWKLDNSAHEILVEIYKDGKQLTKGATSAPSGKVTLSVDPITGAAQTPVIS